MRVYCDGSAFQLDFNMMGQKIPAVGLFVFFGQVSQATKQENDFVSSQGT